MCLYFGGEEVKDLRVKELPSRYRRCSKAILSKMNQLFEQILQIHVCELGLILYLIVLDKLK